MPIKKEAKPEHPLHEFLRHRWSPRTFSEKEITEKEAHILLEAGRWAPSSNNIQPWRIIWGLKGSVTYNRIEKCLKPFNQQWTKNAQMLWAGAYKKTMPNGNENFHALHDLGLFMGNVTYQAQSMGIALHQMAGIDFKKAAEEFNFSDDYHVATATAFGYYGGQLEDLPEKDDLQKMEANMERERKPQREFAFNGSFNPKKD